MLNRRQLGATGLSVGVIGLGTVKFGRNAGVKYPKAFELPTDAEIDGLLAVAEEEGVNLIDTAPAYGSSEERIGRAIAGRRDRWVVATKVGERFEGGVSSFDFSPSAVRESVEASLRRLRLECVDVVLVHSDGEVEHSPAFEEAVRTLCDLKRAGKLRATGASTKSVEGGLRAVEMVDVVMVTLNEAERADEVVIRAAERSGVGVLIKKAFASGHRASADGLALIASTPGVSSIVIGTINPHNLRSNCRAVHAI